MCGRYWIGKENAEELMEELVRLNRKLPENAKTVGEIFPGDTPPVLARSLSGNTGCFAMKWGYARDDGKLLINARSETADRLAVFRDSFVARRCLLPAGLYYEWQQTDGGKVKHGFRMKDGQGMLLAGLYRKTPVGAECIVLTREAVPEYAIVHDRMPVILPREMLRDWLDPRADAKDMLREALTGVNME